MTTFVVDHIILSVYGVIKLHDELEFVKLINFPTMIAVMTLVLFTFFPKLATPYESTKDDKLNSLRLSILAKDGGVDGQRETYNDWKWAKRVARSCPTVGVPFGSLYFIKRSTVLTLFDFTASNAVSALITYP